MLEMFFYFLKVFLILFPIITFLHLKLEMHRLFIQEYIGFLSRHIYKNRSFINDQDQIKPFKLIKYEYSLKLSLDNEIIFDFTTPYSSAKDLNFQALFTLAKKLRLLSKVLSKRKNQEEIEKSKEKYKIANKKSLQIIEACSKNQEHGMLTIPKEQ